MRLKDLSGETIDSYFAGQALDGRAEVHQKGTSWAYQDIAAVHIEAGKNSEARKVAADSAAGHTAAEDIVAVDIASSDAQDYNLIVLDLMEWPDFWRAILRGACRVLIIIFTSCLSSLLMLSGR